MISKIGTQASVLIQNTAQKSDKNAGSINKTESKSEDKVSKIASEIKNGTYKIDIEKMAKAVTDSLI